MESSGGDKPTVTDATESVPGLDGEETLSERESVGARHGPGLPNGGGKEAPSSSSSAGSKRKRSNLGSNQPDLNEPRTPSSSSGDSTWSIDSLDDRHQLSLLKNKNDHSEHSVTSAGVTVIRQPRGVLRLRKLPQNVSTESWNGGCNIPQADGVPKSTQFPRRDRRAESIAFKENRVGGDDPVSCLRTENGTCDQDAGTRFCSETEFSVEKQSHLSGEPPKSVHVDKGGCGHVKDDDGVSLEENAARMLCSLSDNRCAGSPRKRIKSPVRSSRRSFPQHSNHFKNSYKKIKDVPGPARLLRKRDGKVSFRKRRPRRHFYEVSPRDVDPFCIVKERIRVFWPLDETWYFGLVKEYDPVTRLHHVRYDDKDEEWINLQNERIKLLFLPAEARNRSKCNNSRSVFNPKHEQGDREDMDESNTESSESGPISSWLVRSNQAKSTTLCNISKQDHTHSDTVPILFDQKQCQSSDAKEDALLFKDPIPGSSPANVGVEVLKDRTTPEDRRFRFFYSRKQVCRKKNGFLNISKQGSNSRRRANLGMVLASCPRMEFVTATGASVTHVVLVLSLPLKPVYKLIFEACCVWVSNALFLLQHGTLVALWPVVHLDILLVDNALGLKHVLLEMCLRSAVFLFCLLVGSFKRCSRQRTTKESRIPCTSIRFQISGGQGRSEVVFMLFSFIGVEKSKWKHVEGKLQYHCSKELSKDSTNDAGQRAVSSMDLFSKGFDIQVPDFLPESNYSDIEPVICCLDDSAKNVLDVTTAPSLLLCHHLKLLTESNSINGSQESISLALDEGQQQLVTVHASDTVHPSPPRLCSLNLGSSPDSPLDMASASCANQSSSASGECKTAESIRSPECNGSNICDANIMHRKFQDQNGPYLGADTPCSSNLIVICSSQKSAERHLSINIPEHRAIDTPNDKPLNKDEKDKQPVSNLVQELNEHPIGRAIPTAPRTSYHRNRFTSLSRAFGDGSKLLPEDHTLTGFAGGSKKPRSQILYSVSPRSEEFSIKNQGHFRKIRSHSTAKINDAKKLSDSSRSGHSSPESLTCVANVLVTVADRGWREYDTQITMDSDGQSEWRICVKLAEGTKYAHKVCQVLQPGATNRYTHAMIWKGGAEWCLEFPDRSQWLIFKQMHDECYSHNIRAASVRNIPIPGVRLVEINDGNDIVPFVRSEDYLLHIGTDVEIALDESHVLYDMDSDDEEWISSWRKNLVGDNITAAHELAEDLFERIMDKLEKFAYSHSCNELSIDQMKELDIDDVPSDIIEVIHAYWQDKRQKKGMPLIRHFQSAMWKIYEQQLHEWESKLCRMQGPSNGYQEKKLPPKPALFAFCLRPRGLDVSYKGPKQRSHKKIMSTGCHSFSREHDGFYRQVSGRRYNEYTGDGRICESYDSGYLYSPTGYSPRFSTRTDSPRAFETSERSSTPRFFRTNSAKRSASFAFSDDHQPSPSFRHQKVKRGAPDHWNTVIHEWQNSKHLFPGASRVDIEELKLRDAASAAQHAAAMAKLKREKAHCLMHKADLALHKATAALMIADAIKSSSRDTSRDGRRDLRDEER